MKRVKLLRYLYAHNCLLIREGKRHSVFINPKEERISTVPRHNEINNFLAKKICKDLGLLSIKKSNAIRFRKKFINRAFLML